MSAHPAGDHAICARGWLAPRRGTMELIEPFFRNRSLPVVGELPRSQEEMPVEVAATLDHRARVLTVEQVRILTPGELADDRPARALADLRAVVPAESLAPGVTPGSVRLMELVDRLLLSGRIQTRTRVALYPNTRVLVVVAADLADLDALRRLLRAAADPRESRNVVLRPPRWDAEAEASARAVLDRIDAAEIIATGHGLTGHGDLAWTVRTVGPLDTAIAEALSSLPGGLVEHASWLTDR